MRSSPSIVPPDTSARDIYLVLDDFGGRLGRAWRETAEGDTGRATLIKDLLDGQYANPARIVAFNIVEGWVRDVTEDIAAQLRDQCGERGEVPESLHDFLEHHGH
jgi:hypothetical protein